MAQLAQRGCALPEVLRRRYCTNTRVKFLLVVDDTVVKDEELKSVGPPLRPAFLPAPHAAPGFCAALSPACAGLLFRAALCLNWGCCTVPVVFLRRLSPGRALHALPPASAAALAAGGWQSQQ